LAAQNLTEGSIPALIVRLGLPTLGAFVLQSSYQLADLYWVGRLGGAAIAALSIAVNTFFVTLCLGMVVGVGALALISQATGRGERAAVPGLFQQALWLGLAFGLALFAAGVLWARPFLGAFSADPAVVALGVPFFRIHAATLFGHVLGIMLSMCFRAVGDFVTPTLLLALGVLLNLVLDPLLIFGLGPFPALGLNGAAWATLFAQAVSIVVTLWLVARPGSPLGLRRPWRLQWRAQARMLRIGIPSGLQFALFAATLMITFRFVRPFGAEATAAVGVGFRIIETAIYPAVSVGAAVSSIVGQNYGARRLWRVRRAILWGSAFGAVLGAAEFALLLAAPAFWFSLFTADPAVQAIGVQYLSIVGLVLILVGPVIPAEHVGMGLGRTLLPLAAQGVRMAALLGALALLVGAWDWGLPGVFWSRALSILPESALLVGIVAYWWLTVLRDPPRAMPASLPADGAEAPAAESA
jgi:putative MATE family efflux protein